MKILTAGLIAVSLAAPMTPILPLSGCTSPSNSAQYVNQKNITEAQNIVSGLSKVYAAAKLDLPALLPTGTPTDNELMAVLSDAAVAVNSLSALGGGGGNAMALRTVSADVAHVLAVLAATLPAAGVPPEVMLGLQAAQLLLPDLATFLPAANAPTAGMPMNAGGSPGDAMPLGAMHTAMRDSSRADADATPSGAMPPRPIHAGAMPSRAMHAAATPSSAERFSNTGLTRDAAMSVLAAAR